jgi:hypothetical protein
MDWKKIPASRWGIRQLGVVLLLAAYAVAKHLLAIGGGRHGDQPPVVYLLALVTFLCGSAGCALLILGYHIFDKIRVSKRWRQGPPAVPEMTPVVPAYKQPEMREPEELALDRTAALSESTCEGRRDVCVR